MPAGAVGTGGISDWSAAVGAAGKSALDNPVVQEQEETTGTAPPAAPRSRKHPIVPDALRLLLGWSLSTPRASGLGFGLLLVRQLVPHVAKLQSRMLARWPEEEDLG